MDALLCKTLSRTLLLVRDEIAEDADDANLVTALTTTSVVLIGDAHNLRSHAAQTAFITAALLMCRSGHRVYLAAPDVPLHDRQPPLKGDHLISALLSVSNDILPGIGFSVFPPQGEATLAVLFGDSAPRFRARRSIAINASAWAAMIDDTGRARRWIEPDWPLGGLAAGGLIAVEAFKAAMHRLRPWAKDHARFDELFRFVARTILELAPENAPRAAILGPTDFVSGGAITNNVLYALARVPGLTGSGRIIEPETGDHSNLNRYAMMLMSNVGQDKGQLLRSVVRPTLALESIPLLYNGGRPEQIGSFAPRVLVGVDDIPARWSVQAQQPEWLGIGATSHWDAMASFHIQGLGCAQCLHPRDDSTVAPIPTVAFVSFFAGLMLTSYTLRSAAGEMPIPDEQYTYFSPLRPERIWRTPVAPRAKCPTCMEAPRPLAA